MRLNINSGGHSIDGHGGVYCLEDATKIVDAYKRAHAISTGSADKDLALVIKGFGADGSVTSIDTVDFVANDTTDRLGDARIESRASLVDILLECSYYFDCIGHVEHALVLAKAALAGATFIPESYSERRANNVLGSMYIRVCDFNKASEHLERAHELAKNSGNPLYILGARANTVAALQTMGLNYEAQSVALHILRQPDGGEDLDHLHLQNATNGIRISHAIGDLHSAELFLGVACRKSKIASRVATEVTKAYFEASRAAHLAATGEPDRALNLVNRAVNRKAADCSIRVSAILYCAQANLRLTTGREILISDSKAKLHEILRHAECLASHYEEVLETLVRLHSFSERAQDREAVAELHHKLTKYLVTIKHGGSYRSAAAQITSSLVEPRLAAPHYNIPQWVLECRPASAESNRAAEIGVGASRVVSASQELRSGEGGNKSVTEPVRRSQDYEAAEQWALAVELSAEGRWDHCVAVSSLAKVIAYKSGVPVLAGQNIELACRLHDIGKIRLAMGCAGRRSLRSRGEYRTIYEHTTLGRELLAHSSDPIMIMAADIALSHHEWWNGSGYPSGLSGQGIPLAARVCAVADAFVSLIESTSTGPAWSIDWARKQVSCMAGVQLDPHLVSIFLDINLLPDLLSVARDDYRRLQALTQAIRVQSVTALVEPIL